MSRRVCLYGELDPYMGSIAQVTSELPRLVQQLKIAFLLFDQVIVERNVIFDHVLTLPAFESLNPFVKSGALCLLAKEDKDLRGDLFIRRAKLIYGKNLNQGLSKRGQSDILQTLKCWQNISPSYLNTPKKVKQQVNTCNNIKRNLLSLTKLSKQAIEARRQLVKLTIFMQKVGIFNLHEMMSRLGGMRGLITQQELTLFAIIIQGEYLNQVANSIKQEGVDISLFPGKYIRYLERHRHLFLANRLPIDLNPIEKITTILDRSGFPLYKLGDIPAVELLQVSRSSDWKLWRNYILSDKYSAEATKELKSLIKTNRKLGNMLSIALKNIDTPFKTDLLTSTVSTLPSRWLSSGQGLVGSTTSTTLPTNKPIVKMNLNSHQITFNKQTVLLEKAEIPLLSLIASTGNIGVPIERIKQLDIEIDLVKRSSYNHWRSHAHDAEELNLARLNRINVAQCRLNKKLGSIGLKISVETGNGIWNLITVKDSVKVHLSLEENLYISDNNRSTEQHTIQYKPINLSTTQLIIWDFLAKRYALFVTAQALAIELNAPEKTTKQISDIMYKFKKRLEGSLYKLVRSYHGEYCLMRYKASTPTSLV